MAACATDSFRQAFVVSTNGERVAYRTTGHGPSLIIVPGMMSLAESYDRLAMALAQRFTVHTLERRGRGASACQAGDYTMATEIADLDALRSAVGARFLFGHSYGGLIALEHARRCADFTGIAVYEPGVSVGRALDTSWIEDYERCLASGRVMDAVALFSIQAGPERARGTPRWLMKRLLPLFLTPLQRRHLAELAPTIATEHRVIRALNDTWQSYAAIKAPVLVMSGGGSNLPWIPPAILALSATIPTRTITVFPRLDHFGPDRTGPTVVADALAKHFLVQPKHV